MKYFLSILCLFILSCDNNNDDGDAIFLLGENFTMPMNENTTWSYEFISGYYSETNNQIESGFWVEGQIDRRVVNITNTEIENDTDCNFVIENTISTDLIDVPETDIDDESNGSIDINIYDNINTWYNDIYYSFYSNDQDSFYSCGIYPEHVPSDNEEIVPTVSTSPEPIKLLNTIQLDYPLYLGKTWEKVNTNLSVMYEIVSQENIILDINGTLTLFQCYKITMSLGDNHIDFYISNEGIVKIESNVELEPTTSVYPDGSGYSPMYFIYELILTDF